VLATAPQVTLPTGMRARVTLEELQVYRAGLIDRLTRLAAPIP
jgi:hypothetical protein